MSFCVSQAFAASNSYIWMRIEHTKHIPESMIPGFSFMSCSATQLHTYSKSSLQESCKLTCLSDSSHLRAQPCPSSPGYKAADSVNFLVFAWVKKHLYLQVSHLPVENGEGMQVLHYVHGQKYEPHHDFFHDK